MTNQAQTLTKKRGGDKTGPLHITLLITSTLLLTIAGLLFVWSYNIPGIITMIAGIIIRALDTRL